MLTITGIAGSMRTGSFNAALLRAAVEECPPEAAIRVKAIRKRLRTYMQGFVEFVGR